MIIRPKKTPIIVVLIATSLMWGFGAIVIVQYPTEYEGYLALCLGLGIVALVATQRVKVSGGKIQFYRLFIKYAEAETSDVTIVRRLVGKPPIIPGYVIIRKSDGDPVAELIAGNFKREDIDRLVRVLR
jgi:hypothetical protein